MEDENIGDLIIAKILEVLAELDPDGDQVKVVVRLYQECLRKFKSPKNTP